MADYLVTVEAKGTFDSEPVLSERLFNVSLEYLNGVIAGLSLAYPKNEVYFVEIKN